MEMMQNYVDADLTPLSLLNPTSGDPLNPLSGLEITPNVTLGITFPDVVAFVGSNNADNLYLRVSTNNFLEYSTDGLIYTAIEDISFSSATRITADLKGGNDSLHIDVSLVDALTGGSGDVTFVGGGGNDTLFGSSADTTWRITGDNAGTMSTVVEYSGVENLTGAANNQDTFVVAAGGKLSGLMHGGPGGYDTLVLESGYQSGIFTGTGPNSGSITVDGTTFTYDGLEPIIVASVAELAVNVTGSNNTIRIKDNGDLNDGQFIVESPGIETHILTNPATSFTLNAGGAGDTVIVESLDPGFNAALKIANAGTINVQSNVRVTSGNITFDAINAINVADNVTLETAGDIRLRVDSGFDLTWESITPFFKDRNSTASINVGQATLKGRNVDILTSATTTKFAGFEVDEAGLAGLASGQVTAALVGNPKLEFADSATTAPTITRLNGSWIADGFEVGQTIIIQDSPGLLNDGEYEIAAVTNDTITLIETDVLRTQTYDPTITLTPILIEEVITDIAPQDIPLVAVDTTGNIISTTSFTAGQLENSLLETLATTRIFDLVNVGVQFFLSQATSNITIGSGAIINANNNVSINAGAVSDLTLATISLVAGFSYGTSDAIAKAIVKDGATITAGNAFSLDALVTNNMNVATSVYSGVVSPKKGGGKFVKIPGPSFSAAYGKGYSESLALLEEGTIVTAGNAQVKASSNNNFNVATDSKIIFPLTNLGTAIGVAVSEAESYSNAIVNGKVTTTQGNFTVDAKSINVTHDTLAKAVVKNAIPSPPIAAIENKIDSATKSIGIRNAPGQFGLSAGVSWSLGINQANAKIGSSAELSIAQNLTVSARAEDNFKSVAIGGAKSGAAISLGGAVAYADYTNTANAFIDKNAQVDAGGAITISADAIIPNQVDVDNDLQALANYRPNIPAFQDSPIGSIQQVINTILTTSSLLLSYIKVVPNKIATTFAEASAQAGDEDFGDPGLFAISGTGNILKAANIANAYIGEAAEVTGTQGVNVKANAWSETINTAGVPSTVTKGIAPDNAKSQGSSVGGTYSDITLINTAKAFIDDGAVVVAETGDVKVIANTRSFILNIAESGGKAKEFGVSGAVAINDFQNTALAYIEDKATVTTNQNIVVNAENDLLGIIVTGTITDGGDVGVGASVGVNQVNNVTKAYIGNSTGDDDTGITSTGTVTAGGDIDVNAFAKERLI